MRTVYLQPHCCSQFPNLTHLQHLSLSFSTFQDAKMRQMRDRLIVYTISRAHDLREIALQRLHRCTVQRRLVAVNGADRVLTKWNSPCWLNLHRCVYWQCFETFGSVIPPFHTVLDKLCVLYLKSKCASSVKHYIVEIFFLHRRATSFHEPLCNKFVEFRINLF